jgi:UPF0755 protein
MDDIQQIQNIQNKRKYFRLFVYLFILLFVILYFYFSVLKGPRIENPVIIHVTPGDKISVIAQKLQEKNLIKSPLFLQSFVAFLGGDQSINPGDYYFEKSTWLPNVAYRFARGIHKIDPIKVTIPEGSTNEEISIILNKKLPDFNSQLFIESTNNLQGQLFPDTYFIYPLTSVDEIVKLLNNVFKRKVKDLLEKGHQNYSENEILTMASIVEEEADGDGDRDIIAGILWNRLAKGMMLQVDVAPETYKNKGLPESPITNFGMKSLEATLNPKDSTYLFYLHDKNGMIHLAKTYAEHKNNIKKYLK